MQRIYRANLETATESQLDSLRQQYMSDPMSLMEVDEHDARHLDEKLHDFLQYAPRLGLDGYVLGLSGGIDSSLCACLASESVGAENMHGILLPSGSVSSDKSIPHALKVADMYGIRINDYEKVRENLDKNVESTLEMSEVDESHPSWKAMRGNSYARERMKILRNHAIKQNYLVLGTTNATEEWLGYATKAGDGLGGIDIEPLLTLPKTSERMYACYKGLPEDIIDKSPSAELWADQTDEGELSELVGSAVTYESIDRVMVGVKLGLSDEDIVKANNHPLVTKEAIQNLKAMHKRMKHKSELPPCADLSG